MFFSPSRNWYAYEFAPDRWYVIKPTGIPIHGTDRDGEDRPLVFDEDGAIDYARRLNEDPDLADDDD